jgi:MFS family permease
LEIPWLLFGLHSGALLDRLNTVVVIRNVQVFRGLVIGSVAAIVLGSHGSILVIYIAAFLVGAGELLTDGGMQTLVPALVTRDQFDRANGRIAAAQMVSDRFVGPPVGGFLFGLAIALPFAVNGLTYCFSAVMVDVLRRAGVGAQVRADDAGILVNIKEGVRWLWSQRLLRALALWISGVNFALAMFQGVYVLFALEVLELDESAYGLLLTASAGGGLLGAFAAARLRRLIGAGRAIVLAGIVTSASTMAVGLSRHPVVVGALMFLAGVFVVAMNVVVRSVRQSLVPGQLLGRVVSSYRMIGHGAIPLGAILGGWLGASWGLRAPFVVASVLLAGATVALLPSIRASELGRSELSGDGAP